MKKIHIIVIFSFLFVLPVMYSQGTSSRVETIEIYRQLAGNLVSSELYGKLGDFYYFENDLYNAKKWYDKLYEYDRHRMGVEFFFRYSQVLKNLGHYKKSDKLYQTFEKLSDSIAIRRYNDNFEDYIDRQTERFLIKEEVKMNSEYSEFAPSFYLGKVLYSSHKSRTKVELYETYVNRPDLVEHALELYEATISSGKGYITKVKRIRGLLNYDLSQSSPTISKDGNTMYYNKVSCSFNKSTGLDDCVFKIARVERKENEVWKNSKVLPFNNDNYSCLHPSISPDSKYLYFSSDKDSKNSFDIYVVEILGDDFGKPEKVIGLNTRYKEVYPFVSNKNELYFSSDGHPGLGNIDVYVGKLKTYNSVEGVYNLGSPINTKYDDFSLIMDDGTRRGFFASNRVGGSGADDIYSFVEVKPLINDCSIEISGTVFDISTNQPILDGVVLQLIDDQNNLLETVHANQEGFYEFSSTSCNDAYFIRALSKHYIIKEKFVPKTTLIGSTTVVTNIELERDGINVPKEFFSSFSYGQTGLAIGNESTGDYNFKSIYFKTASSRIDNESENTLEDIALKMTNNPDLKIMIASYSDNRGGNSFNLSLSSKRLIATFNYLVYLGVEPMRITMKSLGETKPIKDCDNPEVDCSQEDLERERRSDFSAFTN